MEEEEEIYEPLVLTRNQARRCLHTIEHSSYKGLDVSNKNLTHVNVIARFFMYVRYVNVSGNRLTIEALQVLERMNLFELLADQNHLSNAKLRPMRYLQRLTMNENSLRYADTSVISHEQLKFLELKNNLINTIDFDENRVKILSNLLKLDLRGNALTTTAKIHCPNLTHLYLAKNRIEKIETLRKLPNLMTLHLRSNQLANLDGFSNKCLRLKYINLRDNKISNISELAKLSCLQCLQTLIILENPFLQKIREDEERKRYRRIVLMMIPNLIKIDKIVVKEEERDQAKELLRVIQETEYGFTDYDVANFDF